MNSFAYIILLGYHLRGGSKDSRGGRMPPPPPPKKKRNPAEFDLLPKIVILIITNR